nr:3-dehydroquinate dehydratase [Gammaproteobacteria bacterium]
GTREPETYGRLTLADIEQQAAAHSQTLGYPLSGFQTNAEHALIDRIHAAKHDVTRVIIINTGAWTHTSIALRDALLGVSIPFIEVHISNVHAREAFRQHSYLSDIARGVITGLGAQGYEFAITAAAQFLRAQAA